MDSAINNLPLVSVLIPTFNRKNLLKKALESVLNQDYKNIEIIVTDNASTDETEEIMKEYLKNYNFITYIQRKENIGAVKNGSEAYKFLKGKYAVLLCDDDYFISKTFFSNAVKAMEKNDNIVITRGIVKVYDETSNDTHIYEHYSKEYTKGIDYLLHYTEKGYDNIISFFAMFRKSSADKTRVFERYLQSADTWLWLYLFLEGDIYFLTEEIIGCYTESTAIQDRQNPETLKNVDYMITLMNDIKQKALTLYPTYKDLINNKIDKLFSNILVWHTAQLCKVIGRKEAFRYFKNTAILKQNTTLRRRVFGGIVFAIPFDFTLFGLQIDKKYMLVTVFGFKIAIKRKG